MKTISIIFLIVVIIVIATLIGLSIYYNAKQSSNPTSIPELLGFKSSNPTQKPTNLQMSIVSYIGIGIAAAFVVGIILSGLFIFLPNWGASY